MATQVQHAPSRPVLSERQRQVARAIERGLSNREIDLELRHLRAHGEGAQRRPTLEARR
jgi:FixJ family two-component response regulator